MIRLLSLPMFIASSINFIFFIFYFTLYYRKKANQIFHNSYIIFSILSLINTIYCLSFGIVLNSGNNLNILNISNRITIITSTAVIVLFIHFILAFFQIKDKGIIFIFYSVNFCFSVLAIINTPLFLYKELFNTSSFYTGLRFGVLFQVWGIYMLLLLICTLVFLLFGYIKLSHEQKQEKYPIIILLIASTFWIIGGGIDALTAIKVVDLPPLSWIGSLSIGISIAIVLIVSIEKLHEKNELLYEQVIHDNLTNAFSRSYFEVQFNKIYNLLNRVKTNNFFVILDIDNFKKVNDKFGHLAGDYVLKELSQIIKCNLRNTDIFGRFGGDEFVVLINDIMEDKAALNLIKRIRKNINEHLFVYENKKIYVSCSFGVVNFNHKVFEEKISKDTILATADTALYKSKEKGKNRIEFISIFKSSYIPKEDFNVITSQSS